MKFTRIKITCGILAVFTVMIVTISLVSTSNLAVTVTDVDQRIIPSLKYTPRFDAFNIEEEMTLTPIFTPDNAEDVHKAWIDRANDSIDIQNPYFTQYDSGDWASDSHPIVRALVDANSRGVTIRVQINEGSDSDDVASYFDSLGIDIRYMGSSLANPDGEYLTDTHNKLVIIDNKVVITSSINFSENAFSNNREAGMVVQSSSVAAHFTAVFVSDWEDGEVPSLSRTKIDIAMNTGPKDRVSSTSDGYTSHTDIPATNFTGVYNVTVVTNPDNADEVIFRYLEAAQESIYVSMYTISREDFTDTLVDLKNANPSMDIQVLVSNRRVGPTENEDTWAAVETLVANLIPVHNSTTDDNSVDGYYHNKYWIIDGTHVFVYSGNWSPRSVTPSLESGDTYYGSTSANRDMGIAVHASDVAAFFKGVWDDDVAAGTAWELPVGVKQTSFTDAEIVSGEVVLAAQVSGLTSPEVSYRWGDNDYTTVTMSGDTFSISYDTSNLPNGITSFDVKAVNGSLTFTDSVTINIANYDSSENWRVLITEVLPNPSTVSDTEGEFIEVTNSFPFDVFVEGWQVGDDEDLYTFPSGYEIESYSSIIIARNSAGFEGAFTGVTADIELSISLVNTGDYVQLIDSKGNYVDVVAYGDTSAPDSSAANSAPGPGESLKRSPLHVDTDTVSDFITGSPDPKGNVPSETLNLEEVSVPLFTIFIALIVLPVWRRKKRKKNSR